MRKRLASSGLSRWTKSTAAAVWVVVRFALSLANQNGFNRVFLAVNTDNRSALDLYLSEGFSIVKAMTCMNARIH